MENPNVPPSAEMRFRVRLRTRWSDEDNHGVLNNAVYLTLLEEARFAYFGRLGLIAGNRFPFVLAHSNVLFLAPGRGGVEVDVECRTTRVGKTSFEQAYRVVEAASGTVWCEAEARLVGVDERGAKRPLTESLRAGIRSVEDR